ncbi:protein SAR DEFICIENT 1 [Quercus robur]|uniref:protein SAR DEFICIENT 1 n=1 Tax=Quercus robur TaxID=38942 RepID=UPI0021620B48|nr:protein SAR DEFICIENT 1 [Quercus robur]
MAAKRYFNESESNEDQPPEKKMKSRPSFASVIGEVVMVNSLQNLFSALEPLLRRVVKEEVEHVLGRNTRSLLRSPSLRIQALEPSSLKLKFSNKLSLPVFTGSKIGSFDNNPLQIFVVDNANPNVPIILPQPIKIEIVVVDGDFPQGDRETWTSEEFNNNIVKERTGRRPLLTGELNVTMRDGFAPIGDIEFTDNSSWIRSRKFRVGVRVVPGSNGDVRICEAMTEPFVVKDHRGELYKKHHPPMLDDDVWRLEKIGKDGAFHNKLKSEGIKTVQDFLKLSIANPQLLRKILGVGMSDKMWEATIKHARTCVLGNKQYVFRGNNHLVMLNPICQVVKAVIDGQDRDLSSIDRTYIERLVREAYMNWSSLEEVDASLNETALLTQGEMMEQYPNHQLTMVKPFQQHGYIVDRAIDMGYELNSDQAGCIDLTYVSMPSSNIGINYTITESSSDGELTPSAPRSFLSGN